MSPYNSFGVGGGIFLDVPHVFFFPLSKIYLFALQNLEVEYPYLFVNLPEDLLEQFENIIRNGHEDIQGYDLSSSILAFEERNFENEELDESNDDGNGICLGTVFVAFTMIGALILRLSWKHMFFIRKKSTFSR